MRPLEQFDYFDRFAAITLAGFDIWIIYHWVSTDILERKDKLCGFIFPHFANFKVARKLDPETWPSFKKHLEGARAIKLPS